jgi:hypothetical protein
VRQFSLKVGPEVRIPLPPAASHADSGIQRPGHVILEPDAARRDELAVEPVTMRATQRRDRPSNARAVSQSHEPVPTDLLAIAPVRLYWS